MIQQKVKISRIKNKLKQLDLAKQLGVSEQTISAWETGRRKPSREHLTRLKKLLKIK